MYMLKGKSKIQMAKIYGVWISVNLMMCWFILYNNKNIYVESFSEHNVCFLFLLYPCASGKKLGMSHMHNECKQLMNVKLL